MIEWSKNLRCSEKLKKRLKKVKRKINSSKPSLSIFVIAYASNHDNLFDIINVNELIFNYYRNNLLHIAGLAGSREEAEELVLTMVDEVYKETGAFDVRKYFG